MDDAFCVGGIDGYRDPRPSYAAVPPGAEVFWFFFSKKNVLLCFLPPGAGEGGGQVGRGWRGEGGGDVLVRADQVDAGAEAGGDQAFGVGQAARADADHVQTARRRVGLADDQEFEAAAEMVQQEAGAAVGADRRVRAGDAG